MGWGPELSKKKQSGAQHLLLAAACAPAQSTAAARSAYLMLCGLLFQTFSQSPHFTVSLKNSHLVYFTPFYTCETAGKSCAGGKQVHNSFFKKTIHLKRLKQAKHCNGS